MRTELADTLNRILAGLERLETRSDMKALRPGLSSREIGELLRSVELPVDPELVALYSWRNGTDTTGRKMGEIDIFPGFYFVSLQDAVINYRTFVGDARWQPGWLPVFANGGGDFYVVDLQQAHGPVRHFRIDESVHPIEFGSVGAMLETWAAGFERGVFYADPDGYLEFDDAQFAALAAELNPDIPWWTD